MSNDNIKWEKIVLGGIEYKLVPKSQPINERDWEIVSGNNFDYIHSVLRKSDGVVFSVGDEIRYVGIDNTIKGFQLYTGAMCAKITPFDTEINAIAPINDIQPIPHRTKLFTTEDGISVYEQDTFPVYKVDELFQILIFSACDCSPIYQPKCKYFSNKEKAKEYAILNKPCLSVMDIKKLVSTWFLTESAVINRTGMIDENKLISLAKSKLSLTTNNNE